MNIYLIEKKEYFTNLFIPSSTSQYILLRCPRKIDKTFLAPQY